jgi:hypothetical protein
MSNWFDISRPRGGIAFMAGCFIVASVYFLFFGDTWYTRYVCPWFLLIGIGLWLKHQWARWMAFAFFVFAGVLLVQLTINDGFELRRLAKGLVIAGSLLMLWEWNVYPDRVDDEMTAHEARE